MTSTPKPIERRPTVPVFMDDDDDDALLLNYANTSTVVSSNAVPTAAPPSVSAAADTPATVAAGVSPCTPYAEEEDANSIAPITTGMCPNVAEVGLRDKALSYSAAASQSVVDARGDADEEEVAVMGEEDDAAAVVSEAATSSSDDDDADSDDDLVIGALPPQASARPTLTPSAVAAALTTATTTATTSTTAVIASSSSYLTPIVIDDDENSSSRPLVFYYGASNHNGNGGGSSNQLLGGQGRDNSTQEGGGSNNNGYQSPVRRSGAQRLTAILSLEPLNEDADGRSGSGSCGGNAVDDDAKNQTPPTSTLSTNKHGSSFTRLSFELMGCEGDDDCYGSTTTARRSGARPQMTTEEGEEGDAVASPTVGSSVTAHLLSVVGQKRPREEEEEDGDSTTRNLVAPPTPQARYSCASSVAVGGGLPPTTGGDAEASRISASRSNANAVLVTVGGQADGNLQHQLFTPSHSQVFPLPSSNDTISTQQQQQPKPSALAVLMQSSKANGGGGGGAPLRTPTPRKKATTGPTTPTVVGSGGGSGPPTTPRHQITLDPFLSAKKTTAATVGTDENAESAGPALELYRPMGSGLAPPTSTAATTGRPLGSSSSSNLIQTHLDFGQANIGTITCAKCGMVYNRCEEDVKLHKAYCSKVSKSEKLAGGSADGKGSAFHDLLVFEGKQWVGALKALGGNGSAVVASNQQQNHPHNLSGAAHPFATAVAAGDTATKPPTTTTTSQTLLTAVSRTVIERKEYEVYMLPPVAQLVGKAPMIDWLGQKGSPLQIINQLYPNSSLVVVVSGVGGGGGGNSTAGTNGSSSAMANFFGGGSRASGGGGGTRTSGKQSLANLSVDPLLAGIGTTSTATTAAAAAASGGRKSGLASGTRGSGLLGSTSAAATSAAIAHTRFEVAFIAAYEERTRHHEPMLAIDTHLPQPSKADFMGKGYDNPQLEYRMAVAAYQQHIRIVERRSSIDVNFCYLSRKVVADNAKKLPTITSFFQQKAAKPTPERARRNGIGQQLLELSLQAITQHAVYGYHISPNALAFSTLLPSLSMVYHSTDLANALRSYYDARSLKGLLEVAKDARAAEEEDARRRRRGANGEEGPSGDNNDATNKGDVTVSATPNLFASSNEASMVAPPPPLPPQAAEGENSAVVAPPLSSSSQAPITPPKQVVVVPDVGIPTETPSGGRVIIRNGDYNHSRYLRSIPLLFTPDEDSLPFNKLKVTEYYS